MISTAPDAALVRPPLLPFTAINATKGRKQMETIYGKRTYDLDSYALAARLTGYRAIHLDLGTGDGRFVSHVAQGDPGSFVIGVDACREQLRDASRRAPRNVLFVIANALDLPRELHGLATHMTINFPWGSLLRGLTDGDPRLMDGLRAVSHPSATIELRLNGGALAEVGRSLEDGALAATQSLTHAGFRVARPVLLDSAALRSIPTTWAKRLAFGRDPQAVLLRGRLMAGSDRVVSRYG
jgi:16S rRNA (adenine(1408)-N(1))-methyltransferase